jgi:hypothetical protein
MVASIAYAGSMSFAASSIGCTAVDVQQIRLEACKLLQVWSLLAAAAAAAVTASAQQCPLSAALLRRNLLAGGVESVLPSAAAGQHLLHHQQQHEQAPAPIQAMVRSKMQILSLSCPLILLLRQLMQLMSFSRLVLLLSLMTTRPGLRFLPSRSLSFAPERGFPLLVEWSM